MLLVTLVKESFDVFLIGSVELNVVTEIAINDVIDFRMFFVCKDNSFDRNALGFQLFRYCFGFLAVY